MALLVWLPGSAMAQSACTSVWGIANGNQLRYLNTNTGQWSPSVLALTTVASRANALAGSSSNGLLYYVDRDDQRLYSINPGSATLVATPIGIIPAPPAPALATNILGATSDSSGQLFVYATSPSAGCPANDCFVTVAQVNVVTAALVTPWTQLRTTLGGTPTLSGSGDSFITSAGTNYIISNTNSTPTLHALDLNAGPTFGQTSATPLFLTGVNSMSVAGVSTDPLTGITYMAGSTSSTVAPFTSVTFIVDLNTGTTTHLLQTDTSFLINDMGNCAVKPAAPTVSKSFNPTSRAAAPGTTTLQITLGNTNNAAIFLYGTLTDVLPAGMTVAAAPNLQGSCLPASVPGNTVTATAGANTATMTVGSKIPIGGCTFSFVVTAPVGAYVNTIPAGSLTTSAGSNALQAQAIFQVASTDFSVVKQQRVGTAGVFSAAPMSIAGRATLQFSLTIVNGAGSTSTGTVTYVDTLPLLITPTLSVASVASGGACSTATAVIGGRTRVSGTFTNAPIGGTCTVTITAFTTLTAVLTTFTNTVSIAPVAPSIDGNPANNTASVVLSLLPSTTLTLAKTDSKVSTVAGSVNTYVISAANLGPAAADGALVRDPAAAGLSCTSVTCSTTVGATCPVAPLSLSTFQTTGIPISPFGAASTATFTLTCGVTATGQ